MTSFLLMGKEFPFERKNIEKSLVEDSFDFIFAIIP